MRVAGGVLVHRHQHRNAGAALVLRPHRVAGALGRDHHDVEVGARLDQIEMNVEPMCEHQRRAVLHVAREVLAVDVGLQLVGRQHHDDVRPLGGLRDLHHLELLSLRLLDALRALAQRHCHVLDAGIAQIERMGVALTAIADDGDLLALDQIDVGVAVVVNAHVAHPCWDQAAGRSLVVLLLGSMHRRDKPGESEIAPHIPSGPRAIATMPVRETSTRPSGIMSATKLSILSLAPVISNTKLSVEASITRARKASASRSASMRCSPLPRTLTIASSRSIAGPCTVMSNTLWIGTSRSS